MMVWEEKEKTAPVRSCLSNDLYNGIESALALLAKGVVKRHMTSSENVLERSDDSV